MFLLLFILCEALWGETFVRVALLPYWCVWWVWYRNHLLWWGGRGWVGAGCITITSLFKYTENFITKKWKFFDIFHISAQNIDCGYSLEPPRRGCSNENLQSMFWTEIRKIIYAPVNPIFFYIKVGFKGVKITKACFRDVLAETGSHDNNACNFMFLVYYDSSG